MSKQKTPQNRLYKGDCLHVLPSLLRKEQYADLIYLDPPFNSNTTYHLAHTKKGKASAQSKAFSDTWRYTEKTRLAIEERVKPSLFEASCPTKRGPFLAGFLDTMLTDSTNLSMLSYLAYILERLLLMKQVLRDTGSIYLHCDPTSSHYLKVIMDAIFGEECFRNEIVWYYNSGARGKRFGKRHDTILWYSKTDDYIFNTDELRVPYSPDISVPASKAHYYHPNGKVCDDVWKIPIIAQNDKKERIGYATQKPLALLDRIVRASSKEGDVVLDPFCGCGTTLISAIQNRRHWVGVDVSGDAVDLMQARIYERKGEYNSLYTDYKLIETTPETIHEYKRLNPYEKQDFLIRELRGFPNPRKSGDKGIDGDTLVHVGVNSNGEDLWGYIIFSVKTGTQATPAYLRELRGTMEAVTIEASKRKTPHIVGASIGVLILDKAPTSGMKRDAKEAGTFNYQSNPNLPPILIDRIQILTTRQIFDNPLKALHRPHTYAEVVKYSRTHPQTDVFSPERR